MVCFQVLFFQMINILGKVLVLKGENSSYLVYAKDCIPSTTG